MRETASRIIQEWNHETAASLCEGLQSLLEHAGDVLVDFASRSESNAIQTEFFDAQRELFLKGAYTVPQFRSQLQANQGLLARGFAEPGSATLSLLDKDDYDLSVALNTIAENCTHRNQQDLHALKERLSAISGGRLVDPRQIPLNPQQVTQAFQRSTDSLEINKRVQLVLFTLFDRYVVSRLDPAYASVNGRLAEAGVLPSVPYQVDKHPATPRGGAPDRRAGAASPAQPLSVPGSHESIRAIHSLLAARRRATGQAPAEPPTAQQQQASVQQANQAIDAPQVRACTDHQADAVLATRSDQMLVDKRLLLRVREVLGRQREMIRSLTDQKKLTEREQDAIEIVGMLFEAILDDPEIPAVTKTLLSHLHTPYLKIAINDPAFLQRQDHPARELLAQMLELGVRLVNPQHLRRGIFPELQECVRQIIEAPLGVDPGQIGERLAEQERQLRQQRTLSEKRTLDSEKGQARLLQARDMARSAVRTLLAEQPLPLPVRLFLQTLFSDYLGLLMLRNDLDPRHPKCLQALQHCVALIEQAGAGDGQAASRAAAPLGELIVELLPHYEADVEAFIEQLQQPLSPEAPPPPAPAADQPAAPREPDALQLQAGSWFRWRPAEDEEGRVIKLIWTDPHSRNLLFVDGQGAKAAQMQAGEAAARLADGTLSPLKKPRPDSLLNGLLAGIRQRLDPG